MKFVIDFFHNAVLISSVCAWLIAQIIKITLTAVKERRLVLERLFGDGGMPSGHTATVMTLGLMCGYCYGFTSAVFAIAAVLCIIVTNDAMGVRAESGKQARSILELTGAVNESRPEGRPPVKVEKLKLLIGHSPLEVICGALLGIAVTVFTVLVFGIPYASYTL